MQQMPAAMFNVHVAAAVAAEKIRTRTSQF